VLGIDVADDEVTAILARLELAVIEKADGWLVTPPAFRFDLALEEDLIEEVARIHGYTRIPEQLDRAALRPRPQREGRLLPARARATLVDRGYFEAITYSFGEPELQRLFVPDVEPQRISNPISAELSVMRVSLWPGLAQAVRQNVSRQQTRVRMFEVGARYLRRGDERIEEQVIAGIALGDAVPEQWAIPTRAADYYDVKADVEALLELTGESEAFRFEPAPHPALHPGQSARIVRSGSEAGWLGALHPRLLRALELPGTAFAFELLSEVVLAARVPAFAPMSAFPAVRRDLAVIVEDGVPVGDLVRAARDSAPPYLADLRIFDVYRGKGIESGRKSVAFGLIFQETSRTLTDADADSGVAAVRSRLEETFNARIRD
jgi:phenylalanyl-tRNA synthetase beta chain